MPLYPKITPYNTGLLPVSAIHTLYYEECGNPQGKPVVFIHGGPGGGLHDDCRRYFNPQKYRIILFDQRGAGKSTPHADLRENTTWDLVADLEKLREHCGIEKWQLFGGSWGSTLSLAYAQSHPKRVTEMVLRGIFMCRKSELQWYYQQGASHIYPDEFAPYRDFIPMAEQGNLMTAYHKRLTGNDEALKLEAAKRWSTWEMATSQLTPSQEHKDLGSEDKFALAFARIENHYFINNAFLEEGQLLRDVAKIRHIPAVIVQGRYDVVCPMQSAWELHQAWPESELNIIQTAGHASSEPGILEALVAATDKFVD